MGITSTEQTIAVSVAWEPGPFPPTKILWPGRETRILPKLWGIWKKYFHKFHPQK